MLKVLKRALYSLLLISSFMVFVLVNDVNISQESNDIHYEKNVLLDENILRGDSTSPEEAGSLVQDAINALFANEEGVVEIANIFQSIFSGIGMVNSGITFLKLTGIMKDATAEALANIQRQLTAITDRLAIMDAKLDTIIKKMEELHAETDFINRTTTARDNRSYYRTFKTDYCTKGLDPLITQFEGMQINAIKNWYNAENDDDRIDTIDNSYIILIYDLTGENEYSLRFTTSNSLPVEENSRYIKLSKEFLPVKDEIAAWNANSFRKQITDYIKDKISTIPEQLEYSTNFPELDESMINQIVEDTVNLLIFRTTAITVNEDVNYPLAVIKAFENYAENLNQSETGFDAIIKALYYTHSFEYEISDTIKELCASFIVETAYYGSFVKDVLTMSNDILDEKKEEFDNTYCKAINKLNSTKEKALTGKPNYCYITNTVLYYGEVDVTSSAKIEYYEQTRLHGYMSSSAKGFDYAIKRFDENSNKVGDYAKNHMIGNHAATLISLTLRSNGVVADHEYLAKNLSGATQATNTGVIIAEMSGEADLPFDSTYPLNVKKVIGDYFSDNNTVSMRYLPSHASTDYVTWHKWLKGSILDQTNGSVSSDSLLAALAIYGESHWYWNVDESAFMSASPSKLVSRNYNTRAITHKDAEKMVYVMDFDFSTSFNCIIQEALAPKINESTDGPNPLYDFRADNNYVDLPPAETKAPVTEAEFVVKDDLEESVQKAILLIPSIYTAMIVIPCVFGGIIIIGVVTYVIIRVYKNKKKKEIKEE